MGSLAGILGLLGWRPVDPVTGNSEDETVTLITSSGELVSVDRHHLKPGKRLSNAELKRWSGHDKVS